MNGESMEEKPPCNDSHVLSVASPEWAAARTIAAIQHGQHVFEGEGLNDRAIGLFNTLSTRPVDALNPDDTQHYAERALLAQVQCLEAAFHKWMSLAALMTDPDMCDRYASLAMRAQDQTRKSLLALHELRHPRKNTTFIKHQQNLAIAHSDNHQLKEAHGGAAMDIRTARATAPIDSELEALAVVNGADNGDRESGIGTEQLQEWLAYERDEGF